MTTPPPYGAPDPTSQPYGSAGYPPVAPPYGAAPVYGQPAYGQPVPAGKRPGLLTAAAVLAFVLGGLGIFQTLREFELYTIIGGILPVVGVVQLVLAAALIFAGIQALSGKSSKLLAIVAGAFIALRLILVIWVIAQGSGVVGTAYLSFVIPVLILTFALNSASKTWVRAKGGSTF